MIRGLAAGDHTFGQAKEKWSIEFLRQVCGSNRVVVRKKTTCESYRNGTRIPIERMQFRKYVDVMLPSGKGYLAAQSLKLSFPQLNDHWCLPEHIECIHSGPFMWMAHNKHYEFTHFDPDEGMLLCKGTKQVTLFPPRHIAALYLNPPGSLGRTVR